MIGRSVLIWLIIGSLAATAAAKRVAKAACGFSIEVPSGWTMKRTANRGVACWYALEPARHGDSCSMLVRTLKADFPSAAKEGGFKRTSEGWAIVETWNETIPANEISAHGWKGIEAEHVVRYLDPVKGAEPYHEFVAVVHAGNDSAILTGAECDAKRFDAVLNTFRFAAPPPRAPKPKR